MFANRFWQDPNNLFHADPMQLVLLDGEPVVEPATETHQSVGLDYGAAEELEYRGTAKVAYVTQMPALRLQHLGANL